jgi:hypothetical protein
MLAPERPKPAINIAQLTRSRTVACSLPKICFLRDDMVEHAVRRGSMADPGLMGTGPCSGIAAPLFTAEMLC